MAFRLSSNVLAKAFSKKCSNFSRNISKFSRNVSMFSIASKRSASGQSACALLTASVRRSAIGPQLNLLSRYSTDVALRDFLKEEIEAEKEVAKKQLGDEKVPEITGFQIKADEAEVTLTKMFNKEKITITFNVNDCIRPQEDLESGTMDKMPEEKDEPNVNIFAEPAFKVEIDKNNQKLIFDCEFVQEYHPDDLPSSDPSGEEEQEMDLFNIVAVYLTSGEITSKLYGASGEILDGTLYDHLYDYLAERGIDNKFADDLIKFATHYEHAQYVNLLQKLKEFVSDK